ncbi:MAG: molybdopterin molybdotransferase, partial [Gaiellales bacterium]|nr:molybdopterin molybdotransferase [Gaiellales bacterium]
MLARTALPGFTRSAVDGYAVAAADTSAASERDPASLKLIGSQRAGEPPHVSLGPDTTVAIVTGGALPAGADAVVMVEQAETDPDGRVR